MWFVAVNVGSEEEVQRNDLIHVFIHGHRFHIHSILCPPLFVRITARVRKEEDASNISHGEIRRFAVCVYSNEWWLDCVSQINGDDVRVNFIASSWSISTLFVPIIQIFSLSPLKTCYCAPILAQLLDTTCVYIIWRSY